MKSSKNPAIASAKIRAALLRDRLLAGQLAWSSLPSPASPPTTTRANLLHNLGKVDPSISIMPWAVIVPVAVGGPFRIHSKTTPINAPKSGPTI